MKLIHKVEECAVYESNKHSYASSLFSFSSLAALHAPIKTFLLKTSSSGTPNYASSLLSNVATLLKQQVNSYTSTSVKFKALQVVPLKPFIEELHSDAEMRGMAYTLTLKLLADIGTQLEQIRADHGLFIPFLSLEDIIVVVIHQNEKGNGHKANCKCPICKNMKKSKRGGEDGDIENQKGDIEEGFVKGEKIVDIETKAGDDDYEEIEEIQKMEEGEGKGEEKEEEGEGEGEGEGEESKGKGRARWDKKTFHFIFINSEKLTQRQQQGDANHNNNNVIVDVPLKVNKHTSFLPAELPESALKRLPMRLTTTSWCYSLSALCIYALLQHKFKNGEDDIERVGRPFLHTSLYFCLKRCLKPDPEERVLLYV